MYRIAVCLTLTLAGCAQHNSPPAPPSVSAVTQATPVLPQIEAGLFAAVAPVPAIQDLLQLTPEQKQDFLSYFRHPRYADQAPEYRLYSYMQNVLAVFQFNGSTTSASEVMRSGSANCVSLALLTKALADVAGIEVRFRATYREPVIDIRGDLLLQATHVRSYLSATVSADSINFRQLYIDYFRGPLSYQGDFLSAARFNATVYNNLAAEALLRGDLDQAYALLQSSLQQDKQFVPAINLMAVLLRRQQQPVLAQQWYQYGLAVSPQHNMAWPLRHNIWRCCTIIRCWRHNWVTSRWSGSWNNSWHSPTVMTPLNSIFRRYRLSRPAAKLRRSVFISACRKRCLICYRRIRHWCDIT